jgi:glycosyltransferase involved in cell wall biosynthesis
MKIMIVSSLYGVEGGGSGVMAQHLAHGLAAAGHIVSVITMGSTWKYSVEIQQGIRIYRFQPINLYRFEVKDSHPVWQRLIWQIIDVYNLHTANVLRQIMLKESPDVVHINKMRGFSGAVWSVASELFSGRVVQTCHDYESMSPDGLLRGWTGKMALSKKWPVRGYQIIRAGLSSKVSVVSAPSKFTLDRIVGSGLFSSAKAIVIPNTHGWDDDQLKKIHTRTCGSFENEVRFLFLGRLESEKGVKELCQAFSQLSVSYPAVHLDIAGSGTLNAFLHQKYQNHPKIHFLGTVSGKAKEDVLCKATIVVVPSLVDEVFGIVNVEAFAFGKPVVASKVGGMPELVHPGDTGWLIEPGSIQSLKENLEIVINTDLGSFSRMSRNCRQYSLEFSRNKIVKRYDEIYFQLIK